MKRLLLPFLLLSLAACGQSPSEPAAEPAPAAATPAETAPAAEPAPTAEPATPATDTAATTPDGAEPATDAPAGDATAPDATATAEIPAATEPAPLPPPPVTDPATAPRPGIDYTVLATPQPTFTQGPGIEAAEVFAYSCIHCANLQPNLVAWKATLPADLRVEYVPAAFGGVSDNFARGFFAAQAMGLLDKTHDAMFGAVLVERKITTGSVEELADYYATQGADRGTFLSTMESFAVTAKVNKARQFSARTGVNATPTVIVNGKYSAQLTGDRGAQGLFDTIEFLAAHERAGTTP